MWWNVSERIRGLEREIDFRWKITEAELDRRVRGHEIAATAAEQQLSARLDEMNEFRGAMADQFARAVTRATFDDAMTSLSDRLEALSAANSARLDRIEAVQDRQRGRQGAYAVLAGVAGVLVTIFIIVAGHVHVT